MPYSVCDRIVSLEPGIRGSSVKNVTFSEDYLAVHFPLFPVMPAAMMIDAVAAIAGEVLAANIDGAIETFLVSVDGAKFRKYARPGDRLEINVGSEGPVHESRTASFWAEIISEGERVASLRQVVIGWRTYG